MSRSASNCHLIKEKFCYICGDLIIGRKCTFTDSNKQLYEMYFGFSPVNVGAPFAPSSICSTCLSNLSSWKNGSRNLKFGRPTIWLENTNHLTDCYFCGTQTFGYTHSSKNKIQYAKVSSVQRPVDHSSSLPYPQPYIEQIQNK